MDKSIESAAANTGSLGTENIKKFLIAVFEKLRLDRNNDGKIDRNEFFAAATQLFPEFFWHPELLPELKDLKKDEVPEILAWAGEHFPDYAGMKNEVEAVIRAAAKFAAATFTMMNAIQSLVKKQDETPA